MASAPNDFKVTLKHEGSNVRHIYKIFSPGGRFALRYQNDFNIDNFWLFTFPFNDF